MYVSDLALDDFRSYPHLVLQLEPGVTTFVGRNGQGKTNIVEALAYLATFSSHRVGADTALVRQGTPGAMVRAKVVRGGRPDVVEVEIVAGKANRARAKPIPCCQPQVLQLWRLFRLYCPQKVFPLRQGCCSWQVGCGPPQPRARRVYREYLRLPPQSLPQPKNYRHARDSSP